MHGKKFVKFFLNVQVTFQPTVVRDKFYKIIQITKNVVSITYIIQYSKQVI